MPRDLYGTEVEPDDMVDLWPIDPHAPARTCRAVVVGIVGETLLVRLRTERSATHQWPARRVTVLPAGRAARKARP